MRNKLFDTLHKVSEMIFRKRLFRAIAEATSVEDISRILMFAVHHRDVSERAICVWHLKGGTARDFMTFAHQRADLKEFLYPFVLNHPKRDFLLGELMLCFASKNAEILKKMGGLSLGDLILEKDFAATRMPEVATFLQGLIDEKMKAEHTRPWLTNSARGTVN